MTVNKHIIENLRRFCTIPGKEKTWISELNDDRLFELYLKIKNGESARGIARHVKTVWRIGRQSSIHSISQGILKFRQRISHLLLFPSSATEEGNASVLPPGCEEDSPLQIMEDIARQYEARIKRMIAEERESGVKYPYINRDLQALASLRKGILKQREWEGTHGDALNRKRYERMTQTMDGRFKGFLERVGENGQDRLIRAANRFLELVEQKALTMHKKEDGTYTMIKSEEKSCGRKDTILEGAKNDDPGNKRRN